MKRSGPRKNQRGLILVAVLWIVASLSLLVAAFSASVRTGSIGTRYEVALARSRALCDAGVEIAAARLSQRQAGARWRADGREYATSFGGSRLRIAILDANGRADLNGTDAEIIYRLLKQFAASARQAARIRDYIVARRRSAAVPATNPSAVARRQFGAQTATTPGPLTAPAGQPPAGEPAAGEPAFVAVTQLLDAPGMTIALYRALSPFLTVYSRGGAINPLTAPRQVLAALPDMTNSDAERLIAARSKASAQDGVTQMVPVTARQFVKAERGPAYTIIVSCNSKGLANPIGSRVTIMTGGGAMAPYYTLARHPARY